MSREFFYFCDACGQRSTTERRPEGWVKIGYVYPPKTYLTTADLCRDCAELPVMEVVANLVTGRAG